MARTTPKAAGPAVAVRLLEPCKIGGKRHEPDAVATVPQHVADQLLAVNAATLEGAAPAPAAPAPAPAPAEPPPPDLLADSAAPAAS